VDRFSQLNQLSNQDVTNLFHHTRHTGHECVNFCTLKRPLVLIEVKPSTRSRFSREISGL
jgi:hypothetical protein